MQHAHTGDGLTSQETGGLLINLWKSDISVMFSLFKFSELLDCNMQLLHLKLWWLQATQLVKDLSMINLQPQKWSRIFFNDVD